MTLLHRTVPENITVSFTREGDAFPVRADSGRLQQALLNLAANARDAMPDGGELRISLGKISLASGTPPPLPDMQPGTWVRVIVEDTGSGIPEEDLPFVFEPFFSTKGAEGTGLGLAQVFGIVRQHDGLHPGRERGGRRLALHHLSAAGNRGDPIEPALPELEPLQQGQGETVLVVEDNVATRQALCEILEMLNYRTIEAENGRRALEVLESHHNIALVISDMVMPEMGGKALHELLAASYPAVKVILMTGYPLGEDDRALLTRKGVIWLGKPARAGDAGAGDPPHAHARSSLARLFRSPIQPSLPPQAEPAACLPQSPVPQAGTHPDIWRPVRRCRHIRDLEPTSLRLGPFRRLAADRGHPGKGKPHRRA